MIIDARCRLTTKEGSDYFRTQTQKSGMFGKIEAFKDGTEETFFDEIGLHYVSCSPYRVPIARLAAAQATRAADGAGMSVAT